MIVLSRNQQESLFITTPSGELIEIKILDAIRDYAMLGIEIPSGYSVMKDEALSTRQEIPEAS